ncbi:DNA-directed RNA polymerase 1B [Abeliophyllum distichum]|uniref:DNA-directed RNA polymerase 1B n=1 Tax=Abeliophyllum distichum TaxID=126358 RepID=A0ABD1V388_9LAMI
MSGSNEGICFGCRKSGHLLGGLQAKTTMPTMWEREYVKWMQVVKVLKTKGRLFFCCSEDECTYFKWDNGQPSRGFVEGQSSSVGLDKPMGKEINEDLPSMFKLLASLSEEKDVEISLNLTIRKGQGKGHELDS